MSDKIQSVIDEKVREAQQQFSAQKQTVSVQSEIDMLKKNYDQLVQNLQSILTQLQRKLQLLEVSIQTFGKNMYGIHQLLIDKKCFTDEELLTKLNQIESSLERDKVEMWIANNIAKRTETLPVDGLVAASLEPVNGPSSSKQEYKLLSAQLKDDHNNAVFQNAKIGDVVVASQNGTEYQIKILEFIEFITQRQVSEDQNTPAQTDNTTNLDSKTA